jgi:hypothetical protein
MFRKEIVESPFCEQALQKEMQKAFKRGPYERSAPVKLVTASCDIAILTTDQAWENYCNALHLKSCVRRGGLSRLYLDFIARQSLDRHFLAIERRVARLNEKGLA